MDHDNVFSGAAFRTAVHAAAAVLTALTLTAVAAFIFVQQTLESEIQRQVTSEQVMLREIYDKGGKAALIRTIAEINNPVALSQRAIGVFGPDGIKLAGNIYRAPNFDGFQRADLRLTGTDRPLPYYAHATLLGEVVVIVGHDMTMITTTEHRLIIALLIAGVISGGAILLIGYLASRKSLRKLMALENTLDRVADGDVSARVAVSREDDQIDRISTRVNAHLARLTELMTTTKSTAAAIAHDLKTPLSRASLSLQAALLLIDKGQNPRDEIEETEAELDHLNSIFETILRISRIESARQDSGFESFALLPMLEDLAETFVPMAEERGQSLVVLAPNQPPNQLAPQVLGDARMLRQMIVNLLQNAMNHGAAGNEVVISLQAQGAAAVVEISDRGPGIPEAERAKVFDPFYRLDSSRTAGGSGLGLALVKAICVRHGITVQLVDNQPGLRVILIFPAVSEIVKNVNFTSSGGQV